MNINSFLRELAHSESILSSVLNSMFDGIYIVDKDRQILFWNKGATEITGYSADDVLGRSCKDDILNHIDENGIMLCLERCPLVDTLESGEHRRAKVYALHKSGRRFPVETHIAPIKDNEGNIAAAIEVFKDITREEDFRILQEKFNALIRKYLSSATLEDVIAQLQSGTESKARLRDLTILYLDIVGFTGFSERHAPENVAKMLNDLFGICEVITKEQHGDIDKFIGDAVMAVFLDANDAVAAGEKILKALSLFNERRRQEGHETISVRIGANSGLVVQGEIGTLERKEITVIGDAVNTASRIESATPPNCLCISEATYSRLKNPEVFRCDRTVQVKNRKEPVSIFRFIGWRAQENEVSP